ncbi:SGNH/GDSL hydrolase family protein [Psychroserpens mesophilus]|uniref:SGNH/GDSL hydrolase family protein n=1 Tax=Psychroserpens mesophilus TaxID=325473 RepID=UPI00059078B4|nr:SGNH/GDSL hydrolase family protein [Psychroserpens mesophilus]
MRTLKFSFFLGLLAFISCSSTDENNINDAIVNIPKTFKVLSLGDSYTIGQSVCNTCRFPEQLKDSLELRFKVQDTIKLKIIAQTGWTTTNLKTAIANENLQNDYDLVTLLIGVNNQYQSKPFSLYETEFPELVEEAITASNGDKNKLIVVSIPDYAFTPFGQNNGNPEITTSEIDSYNTFAENYCNENDITYVYITDITRQGLMDTDLIASDNLHPSELAYTKFVERILPIAIEKIE